MKKRQAERKGYAWLLLLTTAAIAALFLYKTAVLSSIPAVETVVIGSVTVSETAVCSGTVRAPDSVQVYATVPCVAGDAAVKVGDTVKKGDVLLYIDRTATLEMAVNAGLSAGQSGIASALVGESIVAPSDGVVSAVNAQKGDVLAVSSPCVVLSEKGGVEIAITIREQMLSKLCVGQEVAVSGVAFARSTYRGVLSEIASTARTVVSTGGSETVVDAVVTLLPDEADESLLIGLSAKAVVTVNEWDDVLLLPYDCLMQDENGDTAVYCMRDGVAVRCAVRVGEEFVDGVEVLGGIEAGAELVRDPERLSGDVVRVTAGQKEGK